jgi:integrase
MLPKCGSWKLPRHVKDARIETREARRKLPVQSEPHWRAIVQGAHVGYYRGARRGAWLVRWRKPGSGYRKATLGEADDTRDADGVHVLDFRTAQQRALEQVARWEGPAEPDDNDGKAEAYTVADAIKAYDRWLTKHRKPTAVRDLRYADRAHIQPTLGKIELAKVTTARLRKWHEELAEQPRRLRTRPGAKQRYIELADDPESMRRRRDTANRIRTILFAALNHAFHAGKVTSDASWRKVRPFRGTGAVRVRYLSLEECRRLMNACSPDFRTIVRGALVTGARYGELCRAEVSDFNADASTLLVRESKGGKPRWIPLDDDGAKFLANITAGRTPNEALFVRADGGRWGTSHQIRPIRAACHAACIAPCGFHALRHTYSSLRVMDGMPLPVVAQVLGHTTSRMVEKHYGHLSPSYVRDAVRATALDLGPVEADNVAILQLRKAR